MKKYFALAFAVLLTGFGIMSCGDDDDTDYSKVEAVFTVSPETQTEPDMTITVRTEPPKTDGAFYTWSFGDGTGYAWQSGTVFQEVLTHTYEKSGEYTVTLSVVNRGGYTAESQKTIKIIAAEPINVMSPTELEGVAPYTLQLNNGVMYADSVKWDIKSVVGEKETAVAEIIVKKDAQGVFTFENPGDYLLYLTAYNAAAKDGKFMRTDIVHVSAVNNTDGKVRKAFFTASPQVQIQPSMNVNIYVDPIEGDDVSYTWDFGDGESLVWKDNSECLSTMVHTYENWGEYTIKLTVKNKDGIVSELQESVKILPAAPTNISLPTKYEGIAPFTLELVSNVMYADSVKWDIKSVVEKIETFVGMFYVKEGETKFFTFENPGDYLLYLTAYGVGTPGGQYMRTDTVHVAAQK